MSRFEGSVARSLDFGEPTIAPRGPRLWGPDKYKVLERRRRQAQITARRVLDLIDVVERGGRREAVGTGEGK